MISFIVWLMFLPLRWFGKGLIVLLYVFVWLLPLAGFIFLCSWNIVRRTLAFCWVAVRTRPRFR